MPAIELYDKRQLNEVYKAVGERLMWHYEMEGEIPAPGDLLVKLYNGTQVLFSYGECITLETLNCQ